MIICKKKKKQSAIISYSWILLIGSSEINSVNDMHNTSKPKLFHQNKISAWSLYLRDYPSHGNLKNAVLEKYN